MATVRKLGSLVFDEVSLVDRPANQHGLVVFSKRDQNKEPGTMAYFTADGQPIDEADVQLGQRVYNEAGEEFVAAEMDDLDLELDDAVDEVDEREPELVGKRGASKSLSETFLEDLSKALTPDGRDSVIAKALGRMEKIEKQNADLTDLVHKMVDETRRRDFTEIAKGYDLPFDPDDMGGLLVRLSKSLSPEDFASVGQILETGSTFAKQAALTQIGFSGGQASTVYDEVAAAAADVVAKGAGEISFDEAAVAFFEANPDAYDEYEREQRTR